MKNPFRGIDDIIKSEFKEASKITKKNYYRIWQYFSKMQHKNYGMNDIDEELYTQSEFESLRWNIYDIALAYTRDYIWFDEKYKGK